MDSRWRARIGPMQGMVIYCETSSSGSLSEPLSALASLAFIVAAVAAWLLYRALPQPAGGGRRWDLLSLVGLVAAVGVGSFLWHALASSWTEWFDLIPVLMFMNLYLVSFLYRGAGLGTFGVAFLLVVFQWGMANAGIRLGPWFGNGSALYVPVLVALWLAAAFGVLRLGARSWPLAAAAGMFTISLGLRMGDMAVCPAVPAGTHFLWHLLNAGVLYLLFRGLAVFVTTVDENGPVLSARH